MAECAEQPRRVPRLQRQPSRAETVQQGVALAFSGGVAGALAKTVVAPLERIKLLNQAGQSAGAFSTLYKVVHNEGWRALWRGNGVNVIRMIPNKGVLLSCSDIYKDNIRSLQISHFWTGAISGGLAGGTAIALTYPLDLARTRMAGFLLARGETTRYPTLVATIVAIWRAEGVRGLFRGMSPTLAGSFPYEGIKFGTYGWLKQHNGGSSSSSLQRATWGALAATLSVRVDRRWGDRRGTAARNHTAVVRRRESPLRWAASERATADLEGRVAGASSRASAWRGAAQPSRKRRCRRVLFDRYA